MDAITSGPKVSIIIQARSGSRHLANAIRQAKLVGPDAEIIVVGSGLKARTSAMAMRAGASKILNGHASLGHGAGRSEGAASASGQILLFINADVAVPSHVLRQYVSKVEEGWDLVLNEYAGGSQKHPVTLSKHLLNHMLGRSDLSGASMMTVPHALGRAALNAIGIETLSVPPLAHATAIVKGLTVTSGGYVDMPQADSINAGQAEQLVRSALDDHAEAIAYLTSVLGDRAGKTDHGRNRNALSLSNHYFEGGG